MFRRSFRPPGYGGFMEKLHVLKMTRQTKHFNKGQRVWLIFSTGAQAAKVRGKFRGKGRYVDAWIRWDRKGDVPPKFVECEVTEEFYKRMTP